MKVLVTGVNGFVGHHTATQLHELGHIVIGASNQHAVEADLSEIIATYYSVDLTDETQVASIDLTDINAIINLAGFAKVGASAGQGDLYNRVNIGVHTVLYQECLSQGVQPQIVAVSTGAVYDPEQPLPITEESKLIDDDKTNEYVVSKKLMEQEVLAFKDRGLSPIIVRPFNHTGPGQLPGFLLPDLAEQIVEAHKTDIPLLTGNIETKRDFTDVRDVARAYVLLATTPRSSLQHDIYNICSGKSVAGKEILKLLTEAYGFNDIKTEVDPKRLRKNDVMDIYGSSDRLQEDTGWMPKYDIDQTITDFVGWKKISS